MKYTYLWIIALLFLCISCYDDKGNYNYHDINDIEITGLETGSEYNKIAFVDTLKILPEIHSNWYKDDIDNYKFEWKVIPSMANKDNVGDTVNYVVSREKNLILPVTLDADDYNCFFVVRDTVNGIDWRWPFRLKVRSLTSECWMVLCDDQGKGRLDVVFDENAESAIIAHDLWRELEFSGEKPSKLIYNYDLRGNIVLYICENGTYNLDITDLHVGEDNNLRWAFGVPPTRVDIRGSGASQFCDITNYWIIVNKEGDAYYRNLGEVGSIFGFPINRIGGQEYFKAAPFVGVTYAWYYGSSILMYDETNRQFLEVLDGASFPSVMKFAGTPLFAAKTGREMVHLESTKGGWNYAILKDPNDGKYYFYCIEMNENGKNYQRYYGEILGDDLDQVKQFACHHMQTMPYLFYSTDHKVYQFDMAHPDKKAKEVLAFPNETVQVIKFTPFVAWAAYKDWERARNYQLLVGTNIDKPLEENCGIMRLYDVPNLMGDLVKAKEHKGLGKIVDITYKERRR